MFFQKVLMEGELAIVKFIAPYSGSCRLLEPVFNELSIQYAGSIKFYTVDTEANKETSTIYKVRDVPHFLYFNKGELVDQVIGVTSKQNLEGKIKQLLNLKK